MLLLVSALPGVPAEAQSIACFAGAIPAEVAVGGPPFGIAVGDVNNDGTLDFVTANPAKNTVSIRLGDGQGHFHVPATADGGEIANVSAPSAVVLADLNNDGYVDFVTGSPTSMYATVGLGDGTGEFRPPPTPSINDGVGSAIAVGDFNRDGKLDIIASDPSITTVAILLGDGSGNFPGVGRSNILMSVHIFAIAVDDFNHDGNLDFITANGEVGTVSIRLGTGAGGFGLPAFPTVAVGSRPAALATGDFNSDGNRDFVVWNAGAGTVSARLGNGAGGFIAPSSPDVGVDTTSRGMAVADFNGDGNQDVVDTNYATSVISLRLGTGSGAFTTPTPPTYAVGDTPNGVAVGDFNGDGAQDIAVANTFSASVSILLNSCDPNLPPTVTVPGAQTVLQGGTLTFGAGSGNAITVADADAGSSPVRVTLAAGHGALTLGGTSGLTFSGGDGTNDPLMTFTGTVAQVNAALNGLRYTPSSVYAGPDQVSVTVNDQGRSGVDGPKTGSGSVVVTITQTQCPPQAPVKVTTSIVGGKLQAHVAATVFPGHPNALQDLQFGTFQNARVTVGGQQLASGQTYAVPAGATTADFTVERMTPGQPTTVPFTVVDACGTWRTFVGGGATAGF